MNIVYQIDDYGKSKLTIDGVESYKFSDRKLKHILKKCMKNISVLEFESFMVWYCQEFPSASERFHQNDGTYIRRYYTHLDKKF